MLNESNEQLDPEEAFRIAMKRIVDADGFRDIVYLIDKGVPFDVAWSLDPYMRLGYIIVFGEIQGNVVWNWSRMEFDPVAPTR